MVPKKEPKAIRNAPSLIAPLMEDKLYSPAPPGPLGGRNNPIPREAFNDIVLELCVELDGKIVRRVKEGIGMKPVMKLYTKVAPTLVLYPRADELTKGGDPGMRGEDGSGMPHVLQTLLRDKKGRTFQEAFPDLHGKALLLNFCSPSVELYPKDNKDCHDIYDMRSVDDDHISAAALANDALFEAELLKHGARMAPKPLKQPKLDYTLIRSAMVHYQQVLKREHVGGRLGASGWRMAWNKKGKVLAYQLSSSDIDNLLARLGCNVQLAELGGLAYRMESWGSGYAFGAGDYLIIDLAEPEQGHALKFDKNNKAVVRTVNGDSFEYTYAELVGLTLG